MKHNEQHIQSTLQRIANILLVNGGFSDNPGLYTGEMGIILFFTHYARYTQNDLFMDYAYGLIDKTQSRLNKNTPVDYKQGLAGIGSAIEYFAQNSFIEVDTDEILEDIDARVFFTYNLPFLSIEEIMDIGYYAIWRLSGNSTKKDMIRQSILTPIVNIMSEWNEKRNVTHPVVSFLRDTVVSGCLTSTHNYSIHTEWLQFCRENKPDNPDCFTAFAMKGCENLNTNLNILTLGIKSGLAGLGLFLMTELDGDDSWVSLFPNDIITVK